jgi:hypothetical protein
LGHDKRDLIHIGYKDNAKAGYAALASCLLERAYRKAQNTGHAVTETSYAGLNAKADALIQALIDRVEDHGRSHEAQAPELARSAAAAR